MPAPERGRWVKFASEAPALKNGRLGKSALNLRDIKSTSCASLLLTRKNSDDSIHRGTEIAVLVLYAPIRARRHRLMKIVQVRMETAVINKNSRMRKMKSEG